MSDVDLIALAEAAGIALRWHDYRGAEQRVSPESLRAVLAALGYPAATEAQLRDSRRRLHAEQDGTNLPPLIVADAGQPIRMPLSPGRFRILHEDGTPLEGRAEPDEGGTVIPAIEVPGHHILEIHSARTTLAVAPAHAHSLAEAEVARGWGLAVQLYALRRAGDGGIGDFTALGQFVRAAAKHGAQSVAISPVHAQFSADPDRFSPYAPSSRLALNVLHADPEALGFAPPPDPAYLAECERLESLPLIDWPAAARARLARFRRVFEQFDAAPEVFRRDFADFRSRHPELEAHARFEALHARQFGTDRSHWHWRTWPAELHDPRGAAIAAFAREHAHEVDFHLFLQFVAERQFAVAHAEARRAGMRIGLISDLAVGSDSGGSQSWSRQDEMLVGLSIGAPPDLLNTRGQNWGVVAFSPAGLRRHGYGAFLDMLRAALRHTGGVRIDHAMGLCRLWVIPEGGDSSDGAYLHFPLDDLLRLLALESQRHRGIVLGEDLGTVPEGFQDQLAARGVLGMRVLWFERDGDGYRPPAAWSPAATAMTSTHDLSTVAGWWRGRDLEWRRDLGFLRDEAAVRAEYRERDRERARLWQAMQASGAASGDMPAPERPVPAVDAAARHVGRAACDLVMLPLEDALAETEQPNLPGTLHEHPNWRRRTPGPAGELLGSAEIAARLAGLAQARSP
jgi:4-alpha-glucanotransferase